MHGYYTKERPPMPGAIPAEGLELVEEFERRCYIQSYGVKAWGIAYYNRKLTEKEVSDYELEEMRGE